MQDMPRTPQPGAVSPPPPPPAHSSGTGPGGRAAVPGPAPAAVAAYEASIMEAFGGRRGLAEVGLPTIVFVAVFTPTQQLNTALWAAVGVAAALTVLRLVRRDKIQQAVGGVVGVIVCALFAKYTGQAKNFYLLGVLYNAGEAVVFGLSALLRWPLVGVVIGPITGEMTAWREHPLRLAAFTRATWMLTVMFVLRVVIELPLYLANLTTELGAAKVLLGYPLYLFTAFLCWQVIRKAPPPVRKPVAAEQADDQA